MKSKGKAKKSAAGGLDKKMQTVLNEQVRHEFSAAYIYLSMSAWFESIDLRGFAHWFRIQAQEEALHAVKYVDYIQQRQGRLALGAVPAPVSEWDSPVEAFEAALELERETTAGINAVAKLALDTGDHTTHNFIQWFLSEQVEEEAMFNEMLSALKLVGRDGNGLFLLDREMAQRTFTAATGEAGA